MKLTLLNKTLNLRAIAIIAFLVSGFSLRAADNVTFTANAPQAVEVGEQFRLQFVLNAKGSNFSEPDITDFRSFRVRTHRRAAAFSGLTAQCRRAQPTPTPLY